MKKYIFVIMTICDIGGSEQYVYNKINYLKKLGYQTYIISAFKREIQIDAFKDYKEGIIPAVMYSPSFFTKKERNRTLNRIIDLIGGGADECIVESDGIDEALWGEMLAERIHARHFIFNVQEIHNYTESQIDFLRFKHSRKELAGITLGSIGSMLKDSSIIPTPEMRFTAPCTNVVADCLSKHISLLKGNARLTIGSIGRLEKEFLIPILHEIKDFVSKNPQDLFNVVLIGGTRQPRVIKQINRIFINTTNVNLIITGFLYPIPLSLLNKIDIFVSTAGSANVSYKAHRPTIKVHPVSGKIAGIMGNGFDAINSSMFDVSDLRLEDCICDIEQNKLQIEYPISCKEVEDKQMAQEFDRELSIITNNSTPLKYYGPGKIKPESNAKNLVYKTLGKTCGAERMQKIIESIRFTFK